MGEYKAVIQRVEQQSKGQCRSFLSGQWRRSGMQGRRNSQQSTGERKPKSHDIAVIQCQQCHKSMVENVRNDMVQMWASSVRVFTIRTFRMLGSAPNPLIPSEAVKTKPENLEISTMAKAQKSGNPKSQRWRRSGRRSEGQQAKSAEP